MQKDQGKFHYMLFYHYQWNLPLFVKYILLPGCNIQK